MSSAEEPSPVTSARTRLDVVAEDVRRDFGETKRVLAFDEWMALVEQAPHRQLRSAAQYVRDALAYYGTYDVRTPGGRATRFRLFDRPFDGGPRLVGQERAQNELFDALSGFAQLGRVHRLLLLHGPNGSAKSTLLDCLHRGVEAYSHTDEGALYRFAWVFPNREPKGGGIGFGASSVKERLGDQSYAHLSGDSLDARLVDEHKDHPIYLVPTEHRRAVIAALVHDHPDFVVAETIRDGELSSRNRKIFDALLATNHGDLRKVLQHVQVERVFLSRTYRMGLVDVEPKQAVDARSFQVTGDRAYASLPAVVTGQPLFGMQGDLVDANRGIINFADLLKRPYEHYKYLLTATETARVALDHVMLDLDCVFTGSANDVNLLEFRALRAAEYQSFRARLDLVPVPYLLDYRVECRIYKEQVGDLLRGIHIAPHVARILALWGVMTRLRRPDPEAYDPKIRGVIGRLTPLQKADLYAHGRVPEGLSAEEARELLAAVPAMHQEPFSYAVVKSESGNDLVLGDYEGSFGASVRDLKTLLLDAAAGKGVSAVTVPRLFDRIHEYLGDAVNHRWMLLPPDGDAGFHRLEGPGSITEAVWERWLDLSDVEVRGALGLIDEARYLELFRRYVVQVTHFLKNEKIYDPVTGQLADPDVRFMGELEKAMEPGVTDARKFRADVLARIGAWALSHPNEEPAYVQIFTDYFARLREDYFRKQKETVAKSIQLMLELLSDERPREDADLTAADKDRARKAIDMLLGQGTPPGEPAAGDARDDGRELHTRETLKETLVALRRHRY